MKTPLAWFNLTYQRRRTLVAVAGIAFAVILIFMQFGFYESMKLTATRVYDQMDFDIVLVSQEYQNFSRPGRFTHRRLYQAEAVPGVERAMPLYVGVNLWRNPKDDPGSWRIADLWSNPIPQPKRRRSIMILGFNLGDHIFQGDLVSEVESDRARAALAIPDTVLFDRRSRPEFGKFKEEEEGFIETEIGPKRILLGGQFTLGTGLGADGLLIASDQTYSRIFGGTSLNLVSLGVVRVKPGHSPANVASELKKVLPQDVLALTRREIGKRESNYWLDRTAVGNIFGLGLIVILIVGIVFVYQVISSDIATRMREFATLKAMGYSFWYLSLVVMQQALILALLAYVPSFFITLVLDELTRHYARIPLEMSVTRAGLVLLLTISMCCLSALLALRKVRSADPADLF